MVLKFNVGVAMLITLAVVYPICSTMTIVTFSDAFTTDPNSMSIPSVAKTKTETVTKYHKVRQDWNDQSLKYYSKIMQEERRRKSGEIDCDVLASKEYQEEFERMAKKHYFALTKIKEGRYDHAEIIYERIIREIMKEGEDGTSCDHAKLAVTTLLLALHCQRMGEVRKTRLVFVNFFRQVVVSRKEREAGQHDDHEHEQCACSAKVLGAFALFEMKQGCEIKSLFIAEKAVEFDPSMAPILEWKQFRNVQRGPRLRTKNKIGEKDRSRF